MVLLIAKNIQLVKFSQIDFLIKNLASLRLRLTAQAGNHSGHHFHNETCQKELALIEGLLSPRQRNETEMLSIQKNPHQPKPVRALNLFNISENAHHKCENLASLTSTTSGVSK